MTIGQKITQLRTAADISQEQLSETLGVSRQSVSKWETDQALPQIDKVLQIAELFNVSTDELLRDKLEPEQKLSRFAGSNPTTQSINWLSMD